jgi:hypothetical protein
VIADYQSGALDLSDEKTFRPIGPERLAEIVARARDMKDFGETAFMYSAYVSFQLGAFLYLARTEPYTAMHIGIQGGRFDTANRFFHCLSNCWMPVTTQTHCIGMCLR